MSFFAGRQILPWLLVLLPAAQPAAQGPLGAAAPRSLPPQYGEAAKHAAQANSAYQSDLARYKGADHVLVLPGLVADRRSKRIELLAEATGLESGQVVEFLLIDAAGAKGYEALFWSHARPSDVHRALKFIGMGPGRPFDPGKLCFWAKGERVIVWVAPEADSAHAADPAAPTRIERLIVGHNTGKPLPETGFVFTGSFTLEPPAGETAGAYAADVLEPKSVLSIYNDPTTVLDVPRRAFQHAVYGSQVVGPEYRFAKHELVRIVLEPEYKDGRRRVADLTLLVRAAEPFAPAGADSPRPAGPVAGAEFLLTDTSGKPLAQRPQLVAVVEVFERLIRRGCDPYVSVCFDPALTLAQVQQVCRLLGAIDKEQGIRIEPPPPGQLYYEAFLPDVGLLDRESRLVDPWELHLTPDSQPPNQQSAADQQTPSDRQRASRQSVSHQQSASNQGASRPKLRARLERHESSFAAGSAGRQDHITRFRVDSPEDLRRRLEVAAARRTAAGRRPDPPVLLVFARPDLSYGHLAGFIRPVQSTYYIIHVFLEPYSKPEPSP